MDRKFTRYSMTGIRNYFSIYTCPDIQHTIKRKWQRWIAQIKKN